MQPRILAFAGSGRKDSLNQRLLKVASAGAEKAGAHVTLLDLKDYPMPLYDGDLEAEEGLPPNAMHVRRLMLEHSGFLIASPEYNGSVTPLLKNVIDWTSRAVKGEDGLKPYRHKFAVLMGASPSSYGGLQGLDHLRAILQNTGMIVLPERLIVGKAKEFMSMDGTITNKAVKGAVEHLGQVLASTLVAMNGRACDDPYNRRHDIARIS